MANEIIPIPGRQLIKKLDLDELDTTGLEDPNPVPVDLNTPIIPVDPNIVPVDPNVPLVTPTQTETIPIPGRTLGREIEVPVQPEPTTPVDLTRPIEQQIAETPTVEDEDEAIKVAREEKARLEAAQRVELQRQKNEQRQADLVDKQITKEEDEIAGIDPNRFWKNASTPKKILAGISLALGAIGAAFTPGGENKGATAITNLINQDIEAQKLDINQEMLKKQHALRLTSLRLDEISSQINNKQRLVQIQNLKSQINERENKVKAQRVRSKLLQQGAITDPNLLTKDERERSLITPGGELKLALSKDAANKTRAFQNEVMPAIAGAKRILKISKEGSRFSLEDRAKIATDLKALVGNLRIPFTGPGILTETEYNRLLATIGDPSKLFALPELERVKMQTVINKLQGDLKIRFKNAGIDLPESKFEKRINILMKNNKGLTRDKASKALEAAGFSEEE